MDLNKFAGAQPEEAEAGTATQKAYWTLRRMILVGEIPPGEQLKIEALREQLDIGSSPLREALSLLTSDQIVERVDKRGFRTAAISQRNFEEILTLRCQLETIALRDSIANATKEWEENIVLTHYHMVRQGRSDFEQFELRHKAFHAALLAQCQSPILLKFCSQLFDLNSRYRFLAIKSQTYKGRDADIEHEAIFNACVDRQTDTAIEQLVNHYRQTGQQLSSFMGNHET